MTQEQALAVLKTGANVFLTGGPGSGKTHTVNAYIAWLKERGIEPAVTASTGIAATHIGGVTIHSWSGIGIRASLSARDIDMITSNEPLVRRLLKTQVLIIDEVSMLDARILTMVDQVCQSVRRNPAAFGDLQVVCVGDFFQLPPVSRESYGEPPATFAFRSEAWSDFRPLVCYLDGQFRQDDDEFLGVLTAIRENRVESKHLDSLRNRKGVDQEQVDDIVKLYSHNVDVDRINTDALNRLAGSSRTFLMRSSGKEFIVAALKRGCLSPEVLHLKVGASVMFTRNNPQMGYVNGTLGTVVDFERESGNPVVQTRRGERIVVEPKEWSVEDGGKVRATLEQLPLRLAWAMTIHKSQGMSLDAALMDLSSTFEYGQGYVALSRVRRLSGLYLIGFGQKALAVHPDILDKDREFKAASAEAAEWIDGLPDTERTELEAAFVLRSGGKLKKAAKAKKPRKQKATAAASVGDPVIDPTAADPESNDEASASFEEKDSDEAFEAAETKKAYSVVDIRMNHEMAYAKWTPEEEQRLLAMHQDGQPIHSIAKELGRKHGGISSRLKKLGLME